MSNAKYIGRIGALAVALGIGFAVTATPAVGYAESTDSDTTALILCGTTCPTPDDFWVDSVMNQFIAPNYPGQTITPVKVTAPMELWPITGFGRLLGLAVGPASVWGLGGPAWPDEPLWKLSGLFDLTGDQSAKAGVAALEDAMVNNPDDRLIIYGYSQGAGVANMEKRKLAEQYPKGTPEGDNAPDIDFVLGGDPNLPNGGFLSRFAGLYIPILDLSFNGPALTDTQFETVSINQQYDGFSDFPLYPLNLVAVLNAVLGIAYVHTYPFDVSLAADPSDSLLYQGTHGDTDYYLFENDDLPLFGPLRSLGVPEPLIDVIEPFFKVIVDQGYDRSIAPWEPTPARLIPSLDPAKVAADLLDAIGEGIDNAATLIGLPAPLKLPEPPATPDHDVPVEQAVSGLATDYEDTAVEQIPPEPDTTVKSVSRDDLQAPQRKAGRERAATRDQLNEVRDAVKSVVGERRTVVNSNGSDDGSSATPAVPARKTPLRDAVKKAGSDVKKAVTKVSDSMDKALKSGKDDDNDDRGEREAS